MRNYALKISRPLQVVAALLCVSLVSTTLHAEENPRLQEGLQLAEQSASKIMRDHGKWAPFSGGFGWGMVHGVGFANSAGLALITYSNSQGGERLGLGVPLLASAVYLTLNGTYLLGSYWIDRNTDNNVRRLQLRALKHGLTMAESQQTPYPQSRDLRKARKLYPEVDHSPGEFQRALCSKGFSALRGENFNRFTLGMIAGSAAVLAL